MRSKFEKRDLVLLFILTVGLGIVAASANAGGSGWRTISAGSEHTCGLRDDGTAWCWGYSSSGERGDGSTLAVQATPAAVSVAGVPGRAWTAISTGISSTCGLRDDGSAWCWGQGTAYDGSAVNAQATPIAMAIPGVSGRRWTAISIGGSHSCGLRGDGSAWCWGSDVTGALGTGPGTGVSAPVTTRNVSGEEWTAISAGSGFTCGLRDDGSAWCWGYGGMGNLGDGRTADTSTPVAVKAAALSGRAWTAISTGDDFACGLRDDGSAWCWGDNPAGALGTNTDIITPVAVSAAALSGRAWTAISTGDDFACGLRNDGTASCWGRNTFGQLGNGEVINRPTPAAVSVAGVSGAKWIVISAGSTHTCGLRDNGSAWCWGYGYDGERGDGTNSMSQAVPVQVQF
jgi:alpha-tubulin suppressor-like RCC1 family protein